MRGISKLRQHAERIADTTDAAGELVPLVAVAALAVTAVAVTALMLATAALLARYPHV